MCDYEDMRDTQTQSSAGKCEKERNRLLFLLVHSATLEVKGNNVSVSYVLFLSIKDNYLDKTVMKTVKIECH